VGRPPIPNRVGAVVPYSAHLPPRRELKRGRSMADDLAARFLPQDEHARSLYTFAASQAFADQLRRRCSHDLELALRGLYLRTSAKARPALDLYAARHGIAVRSDRPLVKAASVESLVYVAFAVADCLTG